MQYRSTLFFLAAVMFGTPAFSHEYKAGELLIKHPYARATVPGQPSGGAYLTLENAGKNSDTLVSASSPVSKSVELHAMSMEGNVMRMREVSSLELAPAAKIVMKPGDGYHLMLLGLKQELKAGEKFPLTLNFAKAGKLDVVVNIESRDAKPAGEAGMR